MELIFGYLVPVMEVSKHLVRGYVVLGLILAIVS